MLRTSLQKHYPRPRAVGNFHTSITYHFNSSSNVVDVLGEMWYTFGTKYDSGNREGYYDLAYDNPFRYRGYMWDEETHLYYLRSRYYNPEWNRFLNADSIYDGNVFRYCKNSPVNCFDPDGKSTIYLNIYLGWLDYGHVDITRGEYTASYGRYRNKDEETYGLTGEGILVVSNNWATRYEQKNREERNIIRFELIMTAEEEDRLYEFYKNMWESGELYEETNKIRKYVIDKYNIATNNCTTKVMDALRYAYGEDKFSAVTKAITAPHVALATFETLYLTGADDWIKDVIVYQEVPLF